MRFFKIKKSNTISLKSFPENIFSSESRTLIFLLGFSFCVFLLFLGERLLWAPDEIRIAGIGANMLLAREWTVPLLNGISFLEKPPLYFCSAASSFKCFNFTPFAAKLPSALSAIAGVLGLYLLSRSSGFSRSASFYSSVILALSIQYFITGRRCITDLMLTAFVIWSIFAGFNLLKEEKNSYAPGWAVLLALSLAGGLLTKGLVAVAVPLTALLPWYLVERGFSLGTVFDRRSMFLTASLVSACLIFSIWIFYLHHKAGMDAVYEVLWTNNFGRFSGAHKEHIEPFWYYMKKLPEQLVPWVVVMPFAVFLHMQDILVKKRKRSVLMMSWLLVPFLILSISSAKRPIYLLPIHPAAAWAAGTFIDECIRKQVRWFSEKGLWYLFLLLAASEAAAACILLYFLYNHVEIQNPAFLLALVCLAVTILALIHMDRTRLDSSLFLILGGLLVLFITWDSFGSDIRGSHNSLRPLFSYVSSIKTGKNIVLYKPDEPVKGGAVFYLNSVVPEFYSREGLMNYMKALKPASKRDMDILIIGQEKYLQHLEAVKILRTFKVKSRSLSAGKISP